MPKPAICPRPCRLTETRTWGPEDIAGPFLHDLLVHDDMAGQSTLLLDHFASSSFYHYFLCGWWTTWIYYKILTESVSSPHSLSAFPLAIETASRAVVSRNVVSLQLQCNVYFIVACFLKVLSESVLLKQNCLRRCCLPPVEMVPFVSQFGSIPQGMGRNLWFYSELYGLFSDLPLCVSLQDDAMPLVLLRLYIDVCLELARIVAGLQYMSDQHWPSIFVVL